VREHIIELIDTCNNLKDLEMPFPKNYLVHYIMLSLATYFDNFKINYNGSNKKLGCMFKWADLAAQYPKSTN
jgi:hypothetical protein